MRTEDRLFCFGFVMAFAAPDLVLMSLGYVTLISALFTMMNDYHPRKRSRAASSTQTPVYARVTMRTTD